nr:TM2 domain-containing protein [Agromyces terreus]
MPPAAPAAPGQPEPPRPPQAQTPVPAPVAATPGLTMTSSSPEFVSDTLRAPSFSPPPVLHAPNEHTTAPLPPNDDRAAASARSVATAEPGERTFLLTWLFALLLGSLGADRFYLGKIGTAVAKLLTAGGFGVWTLVDLVLVLTGAQRDREGRTLSGYDEHRRLAWIVSGAVVGLGVLAAIGVSVAVASLSASLGAVGGLG